MTTTPYNLFAGPRPGLPADLAALADADLLDLRGRLQAVKLSIEGQMSGGGPERDGRPLPDGDYRRWRHRAVLALKGVEVDLGRVRQEFARRCLAQRPPVRRAVFPLLRAFLAELADWPGLPAPLRDRARLVAEVLAEYEADRPEGG
jgi:hypothetical protein